MFSVEGTSLCFLLNVFNMFSVERTQYVFCFLLKVLIMFSVEGTHYVFC